MKIIKNVSVAGTKINTSICHCIFFTIKKSEETKSTFKLENDSLIQKIVRRKPQRERPNTTEHKKYFESERLNCWMANQTLRPHDSQKETVFYTIIKTPEIKIINQTNREGFTDSKEENRKKNF